MAELQNGLITNSTAFFLLGILVMFSMKTFSVRDKSNKLLYGLFAMSAIEVFDHLFTTYVQYRDFFGIDGFGITMYSMQFCIDGIYMLVWVMYLQERLKRFGKEHINYKRRLLLVRIPSIVIFILGILNIFLPIFCSYENSIYNRESLYFLTLIIPLSYFAYGVHLYLRSEYKRRIYQIVPFMQLIIPIVVAHVVEALVMDLCVIPLSKVLTLTILVLVNSKQSASLDVLTRVYTRGELHRYLTEITTNKRVNKSHMGIMIDLNHFKEINDTYGHLAGDNALADFGYILRNSIPNQALAFRYAGDEFVALLRSSDESEAEATIECIKANLDKYNATKKDYKLEASYGIARLETEDSIKSFIERMDRRMYSDKKKNR